MLNMLHAMITEAWGVPLGAEKCIIERDKALDILDEIRGQFPTEIAEAKRLLDARADFINNAKREAENIKRTAEERARQLIDDQEIIKKSRAKSNEMLSYAESSSNELRRVANEYVEDSMHRTEEALTAALDEIRQSRQRFRQAARAAAESPAPAPPTGPPPQPAQIIDFDVD
jgi:dsDNA-specific endonuclease/ATPase MutS2